MQNDTAFVDISQLLRSDGGQESFERTLFLQELDPRIQNAVISGQLKNIAGVVTVKCQIRADFVTECDRCLDEVVVPIRTELDTILSFNESKDDSVIMKNGVIDLNRTVYDAVSLAIPMSVFCSDACKGICPGCGVNLNHAACTCDKKSL